MLGARKLLGYEVPKASGGRKRNKKNKRTKAMDVDTKEQEIHIQVTASLGIWHSLPEKLDPELRVTSWFICTRCINMDPEYKRMRVLDFRGMCAHECWEKSWNKKQQKGWNIGMFISLGSMHCESHSTGAFAVAPRAIDTAKRMLQILHLDPEDPQTTLDCLEGWWACNNCPVWMYGMVWKDLAS